MLNKTPSPAKPAMHSDLLSDAAANRFEMEARAALDAAPLLPSSNASLASAVIAFAQDRRTRIGQARTDACKACPEEDAGGSPSKQENSGLPAFLPVPGAKEMLPMNIEAFEEELEYLTVKEMEAYLFLVLGASLLGPLPLERAALQAKTGLPDHLVAYAHVPLRAFFERTSLGWLHQRIEAERAVWLAGRKSGTTKAAKGVC